MAIHDWFRRRPVKTVDDPVLGRLQFDSRFQSWKGRCVVTADTGPVIVEVSDAAPPTETHRALFLEFTRRYETLAPQIAQELFGLWRDWGLTGEGLPKPSDASAIWRMTHLDAVEIRSNGCLDLLYGFRDGAGWDDAMFTVEVSDWTPRGLSLDD